MKRRLSILSVLLTTCAACGGAQPPPPGAARAASELSPGPILAPATYPHAFQWRQRVTARWPSGTRSFDAVLQKRGGELLLLGLSPMGVPGFIITLRADGQIELENRAGRPLPFEPAFILADVQRVYFPWLEPAAAGFSGTRRGVAHGLRVAETYQHGALVRRSFWRDDAPERGAVRVRYAGWRGDQLAPSRAELHSEWFGYSLIIETLEQTQLPD